MDNTFISIELFHHRLKVITTEPPDPFIHVSLIHYSLVHALCTYFVQQLCQTNKAEFI